MIQKAPVRVGLMSAQEEEYLQDIKGLIDFVIGNRLRFEFVTGKLARDLHVLEAHGHDLAAAFATGLRSEISGGRRLTPDAFGMAMDNEDEGIPSQLPDRNHGHLEK